MVRVIMPLFSVTASGRVGGLIFETNQFGPYVKAHTLQRYKPSPAQIELNYAFGVAADSWRLLTQEEKDVYNVRAGGTKMTGYNLYIKETIIIP